MAIITLVEHDGLRLVARWAFRNHSAIRRLAYAQALVPGRVGLVLGLMFGPMFGIGGISRQDQTPDGNACHIHRLSISMTFTPIMSSFRSKAMAS